MDGWEQTCSSSQTLVVEDVEERKAAVRHEVEVELGDRKLDAFRYLSSSREVAVDLQDAVGL